VEKNSPVAVRALAKKLYDAERAKLGGTAPILPASAKKAAAKKTGLPLSRLASLVDPVYFAENGKANPLPASAAKSARSLASAVRKRRDGGGTLGRWETVRASAEATLGRPISEASVRALYAKAGGDLEASYVGRGTRAAAPKTREDETVEVEAAIGE
jgi:hypothetical protein